MIPDDPTILEHVGDLWVSLRDLERDRVPCGRAVDLAETERVEEVRRKLPALGE